MGNGVVAYTNVLCQLTGRKGAGTNHEENVEHRTSNDGAKADVGSVWNVGEVLGWVIEVKLEKGCRFADEPP